MTSRAEACQTSGTRWLRTYTLEIGSCVRVSEREVCALSSPRAASWSSLYMLRELVYSMTSQSGFNVKITASALFASVITRATKIGQSVCWGLVLRGLRITVVVNIFKFLYCFSCFFFIVFSFLTILGIFCVASYRL